MATDLSHLPDQGALAAPFPGHEHNAAAQKLFAACGFKTSIVEMIHEV